MRSKAEQIATRYFLGQLSEAEQLALEREYFSRSRLFDQVVAVETELIDGYVRGRMPPETRQRFEQYYLAHPKRRERVQFAEALAATLDQTEEVVSASTSRNESVWDRLRLSLSAPKLAWAFSLALLLVTVAAAWFVIESRRLRQDLARSESERTTQAQRERELQQQVANERQRAEALSAELARQQTAAQEPTPLQRTSPAFAFLLLTVGGTRAAGPAPPALLVIPAGTEQVRIQLALRERDYPSYRAALQSAGGEDVFAWQRLMPGTKKSGASFVLSLSASKLIAGDYILTLRGVSENGEVEDVSKSLFRVEKK